MRVGFHLGFSVASFAPAERAAVLHEAEALGLDSAWAGESTGYDAVSQLAWAAAATERLRLGTAVLQMPARTPAATAMTAAGLDRLSGGRVAIGLGVSTPAVSADWHGAGFDDQLRRTREYVAIVRRALDGERVAIDGAHWRLPREGRPMRLTDRPVQPRIPLLLAALGPRNTRLAGEIADGWMPNHATPGHVREGLSLAREGGAGDGFEVVLNLLGHIDDDRDRARDTLRPILAVYVGMGDPRTSPYQLLMRRQGFADVADEVHARFAAGDVEAARAALPDAFLDAISLCGPVAHVRERLRAYRAAGATTIVPLPTATEPVQLRVQLRRLAEAAELQ